MLAHHYATVTIAALSGFIFLRLVAGKTQYDKSEPQEECFDLIQMMVGIEVFVFLAPFVLVTVGSGGDGHFKSFIDFIGPGYLNDAGWPSVSVLWFCIAVSGYAIRFWAITANGKFFDLLIISYVFILLNFVMVPLLTLTISIKNFTSILFMCIYVIAYAAFVYRFANKSSPTTFR